MLKKFVKRLRSRMYGQGKEPQLTFVDIVEEVLSDGACTCGLAGNAKSIAAVVSLQDEYGGVVFLTEDGDAFAAVVEAVNSRVAHQGGFERRCHLSATGAPATVSKMFRRAKKLLHGGVSESDGSE